MKLPKSRAKTALGLLRAAKRAILEEPVRCNMGVVVDRDSATNRRKPDCGAVGCVGGWCLILAGKTETGQYIPGDTSAARKLLGLSPVQEEELFYPVRLVHATSKQTPEHALAVAEHIEDFIRRNKKQLKTALLYT